MKFFKVIYKFYAKNIFYIEKINVSASQAPPVPSVFFLIIPPNSQNPFLTLYSDVHLVLTFILLLLFVFLAVLFIR
jgi:hypothetical protein